MAKVKVSFTEKSENYKKLQDELQKMKKNYVSIGVTKKHASKKHPGNPLRPSPGSDASIGEIAFWNEFGTTKIHERPFMRSAFDINRPAIERKRDALMKQILGGKLTTHKGLETLGFMMKEFIQRRINTSMGWAKPLKPSTIKGKSKGAKRGAAHPLIDSGLLLRSIDFEVKK